MCTINDYIITENRTSNEDDIILVINDFYNNSESCGICEPVAEIIPENYTIVKDKKEEQKDVFFEVNYTA